MVAANSINESTSGIVNFNGTATFSATSVTQFNLLVGGATTSTIVNVAPSATSGVPIVSAGAAVNPTFGTAVVAGGGTGNTTQAAYSVVCGGTTTTGAFQAVGPNASSNAVLFSQGSSTLPAFLTNGTAYVTGISFDAGTHTLSNYAEGTWTMTIGATGSAPTVGYSTRVGRYRRLGNGVYIETQVTLSSYAAGTGNATVASFPFTSANVTAQSYTDIITPQQITFSVNTKYLQFNCGPNQTFALYDQVRSANTSLPIPSSGNFGNSSNFVLCIWISIA